jgi:hypothetical protein
MLHKQLETMTQRLQERERTLAEMKQQLSQIQRDRALPPLENGQIKIFQLQKASARDAANTVESLFGTHTMRVAIDDRTNSLLVFGKQEVIESLEALLMRLDESAASGSDDKKTTPAASIHHSLSLRLFWLADSVPENEGQQADEFLPESVLTATEKLGLRKPRLISQTVTTLSVGSRDPVEFSNNVPAIVWNQATSLNSAGKMRMSDDQRAEIQLNIQVGGPMVNSSVQGSLRIPLGHYMVLGTTNSLIAEMPPAPAAGADVGGVPGAEFPRGPGRGPGMGRFGPEGGEGMPGMMGTSTAEPKYNSSRFAFVVQVVEGESFAPEISDAGGKKKSRYSTQKPSEN